MLVRLAPVGWVMAARSRSRSSISVANPQLPTAFGGEILLGCRYVPKTGYANAIVLKKEWMGFVTTICRWAWDLHP